MPVPDHPDIARMMRDGPWEPPDIHCPSCMDVCDRIMLDVEGDAFGCETCADQVAAWDWFQKDHAGVDADAVKCPYCRQECDMIYLDVAGAVAGCDHCVSSVDSYDWFLHLYGD